MTQSTKEMAMRKVLGMAVLACLLVGGASPSAFASGFAIIEQSVSGLGNAFAGGAASAEDASTIFFNPAGMTLLDGQQVVAGVHLIIPSTKFTSTTATNALGASLGTNNGGDGGKTALVPNFYYSSKLNDQVSIGLGVTAPFGLTTEYDPQWVGRYHAVKSDVLTLNLNPAIAYRVNEQLSLATGVSAQYIDVTLSSMVDGGLVAFSASGNNPALIPLVSNPAYDVLVENTGDDWGYGFNLGALYEFSRSTRLGLAYRSEIEHKLAGKVTSSVPAALTGLNPALAAAFLEQDINGSITLPASASLSLFSQVNDKLAVMGDVTWTGWSSFDKLTINFEGTGIAGNSSTTTTENWDDTWRYALGASYQATDDLKLRTGLAYDETPIADAYRTPRIPGEDRLWVSLGAGYQLGESLHLDGAYAHLFISDSKMQKSAANAEDTARGTVVGEFENAVDIVSVQLAYSF